MAKSTKRPNAAVAHVDKRLDAVRDEKRKLKRLTQEYRSITRLTKQLQRAIEHADADLERVWLWLGQRVAQVENEKASRTGTEG